MTAPFVDVIVLNYNGWRDTIECLESVLRMSYPAFRVVVCDNASPNDSKTLIAQWARGELAPDADVTAGLEALVAPRLPKPIAFATLDRASAESAPPGAHDDERLVLVDVGSNPGFAGGNNVGLRYALACGQAKYVLLLNNDTVVAPDAVARMVAAAEADERIGIVGATILDFRNTTRVQEAGGGTVAWHGMVTTSQSGRTREAVDARPHLDYVSGCCLFARVSAVREVGLLDERFFMYGEDLDYSLRMQRAGYQLAYCREAEIWHRGGGSAQWRSPIHDYHNVRSSLHLVAKHRPYLLPAAAAYSVVRCVLPKIARRQWDRLGPTASAYRDVARDIALGRSARAAAQ